MKKTILCILVVAAMLVSCIPALAEADTVLVDVSSYTTATLTDTTSSNPYFFAYAPGTLTVEEFSGDTFAKFAFAKDAACVSPIHLNWGTTPISSVGRQYFSIRMINDSIPKIFNIRLAVGWLGETLLLVSEDGTSVEQAAPVSETVNYFFVIPADFNGWLMMDLTTGFRDGLTDKPNGDGGTTFTRTLDQTSLACYKTGTEVEESIDFTTIPQTVFFIGEYANEATAAKYSADTALYIGDIKLMEYEVPATSETVDTNTADPTQTPGNNDNPSTGAPLFIGAAISVVASAAYVLNRKKRV